MTAAAAELDRGRTGIAEVPIAILLQLWSRALLEAPSHVSKR